MKKLKKLFRSTLIVCGLVTLFYFGASFVRSGRVTEDVREINTSHFILQYKGILESEAQGMAEYLEANYSRVRNDLADPEHEKISVYVHPDQNEFNKATGLANSRANGTSRGPNVFHLMYQTCFNSLFPADMNKVAVHEFTHCVQLNILIQDALAKAGDQPPAQFNQDFEKQFAENYPQWFWEALSDYEAGLVNKLSVKYGMHGQASLDELNHSAQIYNVGYTIPEFLVNRFGKEKLPIFLRSYCDFENVLAVSEEQFEHEWKTFVEENY
ncbi:hypothetical protein LAG90_02500 [Marinilongibacter aquaticus]|uniref:hypothetical protein n=1 Tax=Marinilongibacter aquaticus TaxID=2975157 RepID=UPI0021BDB1C3|nr:hypothetical protein [Marinilongibacter aquaticus]UBM59525.1 hypothetical protein LAG90_02500 [Marinilongibacter aquaticus]